MKRYAFLLLLCSIVPISMHASDHPGRKSKHPTDISIIHGIKTSKAHIVKTYGHLGDALGEYLPQACRHYSPSNPDSVEILEIILAKAPKNAVDDAIRDAEKSAQDKRENTRKKALATFLKRNR